MLLEGFAEGVAWGVAGVVTSHTRQGGVAGERYPKTTYKHVCCLCQLY